MQIRNTYNIYIGSQRIVSKLGDMDSYGADPRRIEYAGTNVDKVNVDYESKYTTAQEVNKGRFDKFEVPYLGEDNNDYVNGEGFCCDDKVAARGNIGDGNDNPELYQYYYHSDHLGSASYITNLEGEIVQHIEYIPFGEVFIEERNNVWNTPFLFNGKELDEETGLYYYGARYYNPRESVWLSVDPLAEQTLTPYQYTYQNPVRFIDPTGMAPEPPEYYLVNWRGFFVEGSGESGEYLGNVNPNPGSYYELERIRGGLYHKNTNNVFASAGNWINNKLGGDDDFFVEKKVFSIEEETWNDGAVAAGEWVVAGIAFKAIGGLAGQLLKGAGNSIWKLGPSQRGFVYEEMLGANLRNIKGYNVIDDFKALTGEATSIKTLDLTSKTYNTFVKGKLNNATFNKLKKYIDDLANFSGVNKGGVNTIGEIKSKVLELGIPRGATKAQVQQINQAIQHAESQGVKMNVRVVQ